MTGARNHSGGQPLVAVCIITCRRPDGLAALLDGLARLRFRRVPPPAIRVVVVDNDAAGSAEGVVSAFRPGSPWPVHYATEPRAGIPFARNTAIREAGSNVDLIAFIDDDEVPDAFWLDELLHARVAFDADVVTGPVTQQYDAGAPAWVRDEPVFERVRHATGSLVKGAATNNVLLPRRLIDDHDLWFSERFALTGGSDTDFFARAHARGVSIVWADDAVVYERTDLERATLGWFLRRRFRVGVVSWIRLREADTFAAKARFLASQVKWTAIGALLLLPALVHRIATSRRLYFYRSLGLMARGLGFLAAALGVKYEEYRDRHE